MTGGRLPDVATLNELDAEGFVAATSPLFEGAPRFLHRLAAARPFGDDVEMLERAREIARGMPKEEQVELLDAHPPIGADPATVSPLSHQEQGYNAEAEADDELARTYQELAMLNDLYQRRFGFPFVVFVAGRPKREIIPLLEHGLRADRAEELRRALDDVIAIAGDRLHRLRGSSPDEQAREVIAAAVSRWMVGAIDRVELIEVAGELVEQDIESAALLDLSLVKAESDADLEPYVVALLTEIGLEGWTAEQAAELVALHHAAAIMADELAPSDGAHRIVEQAAPLRSDDGQPEWLTTMQRLVRSWEERDDEREVIEAEMRATAELMLGNEETGQ